MAAQDSTTILLIALIVAFINDIREKRLARKRVRSAAYYVAYPEKVLARAVAYNAAHPEKTREWNARYYAAHKEKVRTRHAAYRATHPEKVRSDSQRRRALKAGAPVNDFTAAQWIELQAACGHRCVYCGKRAKGHLTQDHIHPLSQGGSHTLSNILPSCARCNGCKYVGAPLSPVQPFLLTIAPNKRGKLA